MRAQCGARRAPDLVHATVVCVVSLFNLRACLRKLHLDVPFSEMIYQFLPRDLGARVGMAVKNKSMLLYI